MHPSKVENTCNECKYYRCDWKACCHHPFHEDKDVVYGGISHPECYKVRQKQICCDLFEDKPSKVPLFQRIFLALKG